MTAWPSFDVTISPFSQSVQKYYKILPVQDFISKESETSVFIEAKAVALIYCLIKKNDIFHLSEMKKQELHYPPPLCFAMQNIGEVSVGRRG